MPKFTPQPKTPQPSPVPPPISPPLPLQQEQPAPALPPSPPPLPAEEVIEAVDPTNTAGVIPAMAFPPQPESEPSSEPEPLLSLTRPLPPPPSLSAVEQATVPVEPPTIRLPRVSPALPVASWIRSQDEPIFQEIFMENGRVSICNARTEPCDLTKVYGLLLTGGADISIPFLKQSVPNPELIRDPDPARDEWEFMAIKEAIKAQLPILAICRGMQVLNVALGGTLKLDIPNHEEMPDENGQELRFADASTYKHPLLYRFPSVNSSHHQGIDKPGALLFVEAWSKQDNIIEQIRMHPYVFGMGVQYHPERDVMYRPLFNDFFAAVVAYQIWNKR